MAVVTTTVSRIGDINLAAANDYASENYDLFLKKFSGEVFATYQAKTVFKPLTMVRTIPDGKSAQFPVLGTATAKFHVPGESLFNTATDGSQEYLSEIKHAERVINVDPARISPVLISDLDEAMNHYDVRARYAALLGESLAQELDQTLAKVAILTARESETISGTGHGGNTIGKNFSGAADSTAEALLWVDAIYEAAQQFDEDNVPKEDRVVVVTPATFYLMLRYAKDELINTDYSAGNGNVARARLRQAADMEIIVSNNLPNGTNPTPGSIERNTYDANFTNTLAVAFQKSAFGVVELRGLSFEAKWSTEYQGHLMVAKHVWGAAPLRPECAIEIDQNP